MFTTFFSEAVEQLKQNPSAMLAAGGTLELTPDGSLLFAPQAFWPRDGLYTPEQGLSFMLRGYHPSWNTILFRTEVLRTIGTFDASIPNVSDVDFTLRITCRYPYILFRRPCGVFTRHSQSGSEFTDPGVLNQIDTMMERLYSDPLISSYCQDAIRNNLATMKRKRILQVAIKHLIRREPHDAHLAMSIYHGTNPPTALSALVTAIASIGQRFPVVLISFGPLELLRRAVRQTASRIAAAKNGVPLNFKEQLRALG